MSVGRLLISAGAVLVVLGVLFLVGEKTPLHFGRLPGDIRVRGKNFSFYFPIVTCAIASVVLSFLAWLMRR